MAGIPLPSTAVRADDFMTECLVTGSQKMCECMSGKIPADKRAAAVEGMRKSNASTQPGGNLLDPSTLSQEQMQGLDEATVEAIVRGNAIRMLGLDANGRWRP